MVLDTRTATSKRALGKLASAWYKQRKPSTFILLVRWAGNEKWNDPDLSYPLWFPFRESQVQSKEGLGLPVQINPAEATPIPRCAKPLCSDSAAFSAAFVGDPVKRGLKC